MTTLALPTPAFGREDAMPTARRSRRDGLTLSYAQLGLIVTIFTIGAYVLAPVQTFTRLTVAVENLSEAVDGIRAEQRASNTAQQQTASELRAHLAAETEARTALLQRLDDIERRLPVPNGTGSRSRR